MNKNLNQEQIQVNIQDVPELIRLAKIVAQSEQTEKELKILLSKDCSSYNIAEIYKFINDK